jgi:peptidoglycan/xylan/chitin deacetylase (PgdA/CDA1 family)
MPTAKSTARTLLHNLGGLHGFRLVNRRGIRILMYHRFTKETDPLKQQCEIIRRNFSPVSLSSISEYLRAGAPLPRNAVAITVDDGYRDFLQHGYPVFRDYDIPSTVFLVSDFLDGKIWLWWNQIEYALRHTKQDSLTLALPLGEDLVVSLTSDEERRVARQKISERLKAVENSQRLRICEQIAGMLEVEIPVSPPEEYEPLRWSEVRELARNGVEFGAHTKTHPILSRLSDQAQLCEEIEGSKRRLEEELGTPAIHFCYPNGRRADFNDAALKLVEECGFRLAVTTERGMNFAGADPFLLRRLGVEPTIPAQYFQELLAGVRKE